MAKTEKNVPKTQDQLENERITPYLNETGKPLLNEYKRGNDVSVRSDNIKDLSVDLEYISEAMLYYFQKVIKPYTLEQGTQIVVPVMFASPERWKSAQMDGGIRDKEGQIMFPVIALKLDNIEPNRTLGTKLDGNKVHLYQVYEKKYSKKNFYDNFSVLNNRVPIKEYYSLIVPDYYTITYSCAVFTSFMGDLTKIIEDIGFRSNSYWGEPNKFQFKARIDSFPITTTMEQGEDRKFISIFQIILNGYIIPDYIGKNLATYPKFFSKAKVTFKTEFVGGVEEIIQATNKPIKTPFASSQKSVKSATLDSSVITYLNTSKPLKAVSVSSGSAVFNGTFLQPPNNSGLPVTSVNNFTFWVNGQLIEYDGIVSFTDNLNGTCTLVVDPTEIGFTFDSDWEIIAIGKFE